MIIHALSVSDHVPPVKIQDLSLSDILDHGQGLLEFIQFLKEQNSYSMVQFYYAVDSYKKIFKFIGQDKDLGKHALEIYNLFFCLDSNPNTRIFLNGHGHLLKKTLSNIYNQVDSEVFDPVLKCIVGLLEDRYLPLFRKSKYYKDYLKESSSNSPGLKRKEDQTRQSYILQKLDFQIKGKLDLLSLQEDMRFLELKIKETQDKEIIVELENEILQILDRIKSMELRPSLDSFNSSSQKAVKLEESLETIDDRKVCTKSISKAFSCVGHSFRRSFQISKTKARCKSQEPYKKTILEVDTSCDSAKDVESLEKSLSEETIVSSVSSRDRSKTASILESLREQDLQVVKYAGIPTTKAEKVKLEEMSFVLDCACEVIEEIFHLSAPTNWLRSQGLYLVKKLLRNAYGSAISEMIQNYVSEFLKEDTISFYLDTIREYVWPNNDFEAPTEEEKALTKSIAWDLLMEQGAPRETKLGIGIDRIQSIVGKYNTIIGLTRLFNMLQREELNRLLVFSILEAIIDHSCIQ